MSADSDSVEKSLQIFELALTFGAGRIENARGALECSKGAQCRSGSASAE